MREEYEYDEEDAARLEEEYTSEPNPGFGWRIAVCAVCMVIGLVCGIAIGKTF